MKDVSEHIKIVLQKHEIENYQLALWLLTVTKDLLTIELALRECESYSLNKFERVENPHIRNAGLPSAEGCEIDIIENKTVRIEFIYGQNSPDPDICELPLIIYKELLYDYYRSITPDNFYSNGQIKVAGQSHNFLRFGLWAEYYSSGQIKLKGEYKNSQKIGEWNYFHENGQCEAIEFYDIGGYRFGNWESRYKDGQLKWKSFFKNNEYSEDSFYWYENGQLASHTVYSENNKRKDGEHKTWWENGNLKTTLNSL